MAIFHADHHNGNFTQLQNAIPNDPNLSCQAAHILWYLLTKPPHWKIIPNQLIAEFCTRRKLMGRNAVYEVLAQLRELGYLIRRTNREGGRFKGYEYELYEEPQTRTVDASAPFPDSRDTVSGDTLVNTENPNNTENPYCASADAPRDDDVELTTPTPPPEPIPAPEPEPQPPRPPEPSLEAAFAVFWDAGMMKKDRKRAFGHFQRLVRGKRDAMAFAERLAEDVRWRRQWQFGFQNMNPKTYLRDERWHDERKVKTAPSASRPPAEPTSHASYRSARAVLHDQHRAPLVGVASVAAMSIERGQGLAQAMSERFSQDPRDCLAQMRAMVGSA